MIPSNPKAIYKHNKTGRSFRVVGLNRSETLKWVNGQPHFKWMVYCRFIDNDEPCKMFFDEYDNKYKEVWK